MKIAGQLKARLVSLVYRAFLAQLVAEIPQRFLAIYEEVFVNRCGCMFFSRRFDRQVELWLSPVTRGNAVTPR